MSLIARHAPPPGTFLALVIALTLVGAGCSEGGVTAGDVVVAADAALPAPKPPARNPSTTLVTETVAPTKASTTGLRFAEAAAEVGIFAPHSTPFAPKKEGAEMMGGAAAGDFNNDGWMDLYIIGGGLSSDRLYLNRGDGTFDDVASAAGLGERHVGSGATVGDYNGDGHLDIFVTSFGSPDDPGPGNHRLYRNNGDVTFTNVAAAAGVSWSSAETGDGFGSAFGDYDLDGDLDLFVAGWVKQSAGNRLFRNNGDGTFTDVTDAAGIVDNGIRGFSPCLADMDGDRYPELLLVADFGTSEYFINRGDGTFVNRTDAAGVGQEWSGMGTAVGDVNNDGRLDWYTTAIYDDDHEGRGDGNKLYLNVGQHRYEEVAAAVGVADGGWGWGTVITDLDLDGHVDIVETNGWALPAYTGELSKVWISDGAGSFEERAAEVGLVHDLFGLGVIHLDIDNDGDQEIGITTPNDVFRLYRNDLVAKNAHWLRVILDTSARDDLAPDGFGAVVRVESGDSEQARHVVGCSNFSTQSELTAHFGLGSGSDAVQVVVEWPDGSTTQVEAAVDQIIVITPEG